MTVWIGELSMELFAIIEKWYGSEVQLINMRQGQSAIKHLDSLRVTEHL